MRSTFIKTGQRLLQNHYQQQERPYFDREHETQPSSFCFSQRSQLAAGCCYMVACSPLRVVQRILWTMLVVACKWTLWRRLMSTVYNDNIPSNSVYQIWSGLTTLPAERWCLFSCLESKAAKAEVEKWKARREDNFRGAEWKTCSLWKGFNAVLYRSFCAYKALKDLKMWVWSFSCPAKKLLCVRIVFWQSLIGLKTKHESRREDTCQAIKTPEGHTYYYNSRPFWSGENQETMGPGLTWNFNFKRWQKNLQKSASCSFLGVVIHSEGKTWHF